MSKVHRIYMLAGGEFMFVSRYGGKFIGTATPTLERCVAHGIDIDEATLALTELISKGDHVAEFGAIHNSFIFTTKLVS